MGIATAAAAQSMYDARNFSANTSYGSARTIGMGNAVTAVGGDLGSIWFNPAGGAVAGYSQIMLGPGVSISTNSTTGSILTEGSTVPEGFGDANSTSHPRFTLPSFGASLNVNTNRERGLVSYSISVLGTPSANFLNEIFASGLQDRSTYLGYLATQADGIPSAELNGSGAYDNYPWLPVTAYQAGLIATYNGYTDKYAGATEFIQGEEIGLAGELDQRYGQLVFGNKYDIVFNWAGNISNFLYIGANLGITSLDYRYDDYIREQAIRSADFPIPFDDGTTKYFNDAKARYSYTASGAGVYAQLGLLARLPGGVRIGASVQTPTVIGVKERWSQDMSINYLGESTLSAESPTGKYSWRCRTPWRFNAGLAWTIGQVGLISADYELMNYKDMKLRSAYRNDSEFSDANWEISQYMGVSHALRVGAEFKPVRKLALRAGYGLVTSPEKGDDGKYITQSRTIGGNPVKVRSHDSSFSLGAGFISDGSFFADVAVRVHLKDNIYVRPYADYIENVPSPEITVFKNNLWDVFATVGWRF